MGWKVPLVLLTIVVAALLAWSYASAGTGQLAVSDAVGLSESIAEPVAERASSSAKQTTQPAPGLGEAARAEHPSATGRWVLAGTTKLGWRKVMPLAKVEITIFAGYRAEGTPLHTLSAKSDAEGHFAVAIEPPESTVTVVARPDIEGVRKSSDKRVVVSQQAAPTDLEVRIYPLDRQLSGRVVDAQGKGLAGAMVQVRYKSKAVICDDDGRFEVPVSSAERLSLQAAASGYAVVRKQVPMPKLGNPGPVLIELQPGLTVRGRVVDQLGDPVVGADITTFYTSFFVHQTSDEDGRFVFDYLQRSRRSHSLFARREGYVEAQAQVDAEQPKDFYELVMKRGVRVEGLVIDHHGKPVAGALLYIGFDPSAYNRLDAQANDDGQFVFPTVEPDRHDLVVEVRGHAPRKMELIVPKDVAVMSGVIVQLDAAHFVAGSVVDQSGKPLEGVHVHARLPSESSREGRYIGEGVEAKADGTFRLVDLPGGVVDLEFYSPEILRHVEKAVRVDQAAARIKLQRAAKLAGRVVDAVTGKPVRSFRIKIIKGGSRGYGASWLRGHEMAADDGRWRSDNEQLEPGSVFVVEAAARGYGRVLKEMKATLDADPDAYLFKMSPGQTIRGRVVAQGSGAPVKGVRVLMFTDLDPIRIHSARDLETRLTATSDVDGRFVMHDAPLGRISLALQHPSYPSCVDGPFEVLAGVVSERSILLAGSARVVGSIVDAAGRPIAGAKLTLRQLDASSGDPLSKTTVSDGAGRFVFDQGLHAGRFRLSRRGDGSGQVFTASQAVFELKGGERRELQLTPYGDCTLVGTIRTADGGAPPKQVTVFLSRLERGELVSFSCTAIAGRFEMRGLPAGEINVLASAWASSAMWRSGQQKVQVSPAKPTQVELVLKKQSR